MPPDLAAVSAQAAARLAPALRGGDVYTDDRAPVERHIDAANGMSLPRQPRAPRAVVQVDHAVGEAALVDQLELQRHVVGQRRVAAADDDRG